MTDEVKEAPRADNMELRDYFAAQVLAHTCTTTSTYMAAAQAYDYANAMMLAREFYGKDVDK